MDKLEVDPTLKYRKVGPSDLEDVFKEATCRV
jgi:hypothetical protein